MTEELERKLYVGIPKGSLNNPKPNRGHTELLLKYAGGELNGYEPKHETSYPELVSEDKEIKFICMRPRCMPFFLKKGMLDMAICGQDIIQEHFAKNAWMEFERDLAYHSIKSFMGHLKDNPQNNAHYRDIYNAYQESIREGFHKITLVPEKEYWKDGRKYTSIKNPGKRIKMIEDLGYGKVRLNFSVRKDLKEKIRIHANRKRDIADVIRTYPASPLNIITEYPYLAYFALAGRIHPEHIGIFGLKHYSGDSGSKVEIIEANGTEVFLSTPLCEAMFDSISTGRHLKEHGLVELGIPVLESTAGVFMREDINRAGPAYLKEKNKLNNQNQSKKQKESEAVWVSDKIKEVTERLKQASLEYGKTRPDSVHFKGEQK